MLQIHEETVIKEVKKYHASIKGNHSTNGHYYDFIFLCGADRKVSDNRMLVADLINSTSRRSTLYSEDLFVHLEKLDLLTFEEILLEISQAVIIILESWGAACELGAFSYVNLNLNKLYVINDIKHQHSRSFITDGPLKKIQVFSSEQRVFYEKFVKNSSKETLIISSDLRNSLLSLSQKKYFSSQVFKVENNNIIFSDISYLLWLIFDLVKIFGTIRRNTFFEIIKEIFAANAITIKNKSGNVFEDQNTVRNIFDFLQNILVEFKLFQIQKEYCIINFQFLSDNRISLNSFTSVLFKESFLKSRDALKMRSVVINKAKKNGLNIWS